MIAYLEAEKLSRAEESALIAAAQGGDVEARNRLIVAHLPFVKWWALKQKRPTWMELYDVIGVGVLGLIRAIEKYKAGDCKLTNYAKFWMQAKLADAVNKGHLVQIPRYALTHAKQPGRLKEHIARAVLAWTGGMRTLPSEAFERMSQRWWAERYPLANR